jgi:hypothetical protein
MDALPPHIVDKRYVYGARCLWHGSIWEVGAMPVGEVRGLPCCPWCKGALFELPSKEVWTAQVEKFAAKPGVENYVEFIEWVGEQTQCWPIGTRAAEAAFTAATGKIVRYPTT